MSSQKQWHRARAGVMDTVRQLRREADFWHDRCEWFSRRPPWWKFWAVRKRKWGGTGVNQYRVKDSVNLFCDLAPHGFTFFGNYHRGDNWECVMTGIDVATGGDPQNGITIHGDWDNRRIYFKHPYRNSLENVSVGPLIGDLIQAGLVELCAEQEQGHG